MATDALILLNPEAGALREDPGVWQVIQRHPALEGAEIRLLPEVEELREAAAEACRKGCRMVVVGGGDGTISAAVNGILRGREEDAVPEDGPTFAVLPLGTGNDLARSLGLGTLEDALEALSTGATRRMDLIRVTVEGGDPIHCTNAVVGGLGAEVGEHMTPERKERWGLLAYARSGVEALNGEIRGFPLRLSVDGGEAEERTLLNLIIANGRFAGGGIPAAPEARIDDGLMDLVTVREMPLSRMAALAPRLLAGRHLDHEAVDLERVERARVETDEPVGFSLDGEQVRCDVLDALVVPGALTVVVNTESEAVGGP